MSSLAFPIAQELPADVTPERAFRCLASLPHCLFLDSAMPHSVLGRYSFVAADPAQVTTNPRLDCISSSVPQAARADLPPFQGGWAGLFCYELGRHFESLPQPEIVDFGFPAVVLANYDTVVAFDHLKQHGWIVSRGQCPEDDQSKQQRSATERIEQFAARLAAAPAHPIAQHLNERVQVGVNCLNPVGHGLSSNFSRHGYEHAVARVIDYIRAGDVFQVNLSQRLLRPLHDNPVELYLRLRETTPAPFSAYFDAGAFRVLSASPERFLSVSTGVVESRPIKGTRRFSEDREADLQHQSALIRSEKDRAENVMIVDLVRNDLSRVCQPESLNVTQLCELESYGYVHHLVSAVQGTLAPGLAGRDLIAATFPGGSVTGAPKVRAMEIITELERVRRGPYCGALGYFSVSGDLDLSLLIRTATLAGGWLQLPVGGGVVADSDPAAEYEETWAKAEPFLRIL